MRVLVLSAKMGSSDSKDIATEALGHILMTPPRCHRRNGFDVHDLGDIR